MSDEISAVTTDDPSLLPGTEAERAAEDRAGMSTISSEELPMLPGELRAHPEPFQYVMIAVILVVITGLEVGTYYLPHDFPRPLYVAILLAFALTKFVTVVSYYMHLRTDRPIFRRFFITGAVGAVVLFAIVLSTLHIFQ
jgi:cytochrome c oxidase subunit 4